MWWNLWWLLAGIIVTDALRSFLWSQRRPSFFFHNSIINNKKPMVTFPSDTDPYIVHQHFMRLAIHEARQAARRNEVPIGALVVRNVTQANDHDTTTTFRVVATGRNRVEARHDASAHAELVALRRAAARSRDWRLLNCTLYSTLEPCPMCLAATQAFRVSRLVYGAPDARLGAVETHVRLLEIAQHPFHNVSVVATGVLRDECADMMRTFFRMRRKQKNKNAASDRKESRGSLGKWWLRRVWSRLRGILLR